MLRIVLFFSQQLNKRAVLLTAKIRLINQICGRTASNKAKFEIGMVIIPVIILFNCLL